MSVRHDTLHHHTVSFLKPISLVAVDMDLGIKWCGGLVHCWLTCWTREGHCTADVWYVYSTSLKQGETWWNWMKRGETGWNVMKQDETCCYGVKHDETWWNNETWCYGMILGETGWNLMKQDETWQNNGIGWMRTKLWDRVKIVNIGETWWSSETECHKMKEYEKE